jgi:FkbM family methyltransferase
MSLDDINRQYEDNPTKTLRLLGSDPAALLQVGTRKALTALQPFPDLPAEKVINGVRFRFDFDFTLISGDESDEFRRTLIKDMYYESYRMLLVRTIQRHLKPGDIFFDLGASLGYISALAAGFVGKTGQVHAFEPMPQYARSIQQLADLNPDYTIVVNPVAVGESPGEASIAVDTTVFSGSSLAADANGQNYIQVPVICLDDYIAENNLKDISLLFIEVEGYEVPALKGMQRYLNTGQRPPIICAVHPYYYPVEGYTLDDLAAFIDSYGYEAHLLSQPGVAIDVRNLDGHTLTLLTPR